MELSRMAVGIEREISLFLDCSSTCEVSQRNERVVKFLRVFKTKIEVS